MSRLDYHTPTIWLRILAAATELDAALQERANSYSLPMPQISVTQDQTSQHC